MQLFCIVATPRTGSTWLCSRLDGHDKLACHQEVFHPKEIFSKFHYGTETARPVGPAYELTKRFRNRFPRFFLSRLISKTMAQNAELQAVGFKIFPDHNPWLLNHLVESAQWKIIFLTRKNRLAQYSSLKIAKLSGTWVTRERTPAIAPSKIEFNRSEFKKFRENQDKIDSEIAEKLVLNRSFFIDYDELNLRTPELLKHLGVEPEDRLNDESLTMKQNTGKLIDRFSNPDDVRTEMTEENLRYLD